MFYLLFGMSIGNSILALTIGSEEALIPAIVALLLALAAYFKSKASDKKSDDASGDAKDSLAASSAAQTTATSAKTSADLANDRVSNVSRAQDTIRSDLTMVAKDQVPSKQDSQQTQQDSK